MKIYIMTDLEGPAGVLNRNDWVHLGSPYYEKAKMLLTKEVNAAIRGFFNAGATEILVSDGHGSGGIQPELLDKRALLLRGYPTGYPCELTEEYDCVAWIGQHAKAGAIIFRQRGTKIHPGTNVGRGGDDTLFAKVTGTVKYERLGRDRKQVSVYEG